MTAMLAEFFHMGGYGVYVWTSYGAALFMLVGSLLLLWRRKRRLLAAIHRD